jgi:hypothetical protein
MTGRSISYETREEFFELLTGGVPLSVASAAVGVSPDLYRSWSRRRQTSARCRMYRWLCGQLSGRPARCFGNGN